MTERDDYSTVEPEPALGTTTSDARAAAIRSLKKKREFISHLLAYVLVNALLVTIWLITAIPSGAWFPWPLIPMMGWGIGLGFHAAATYGPASRPVTEEAIRREMERLGRR
ncbi:hypothetical protein GCM10009841_03040 [Microlunatus panaciterrae]|uniref:2TM domain-containing protein n=1 Tax=Microlunatus panaciterrae TaxID=400768 RepID=A0ABS2RJ46_9ACTN|nr:2TM domain-containing protein [Microlunatus panaciterrae]MBM7799035.1 hypothetical protein [Microlunatus panaciterrae]